MRMKSVKTVAARPGRQRVRLVANGVSQRRKDAAIMTATTKGARPCQARPEADGNPAS